MGAGVAVDCAVRYPEITTLYGKFCIKNQSIYPHPIFIHQDEYTKKVLVLMATKPLNKENPHISWKYPADIDLIRSGLDQLVATDFSAFGVDTVVIPMVGCGRGGLNEDLVLPIMLRKLDNRFILVDTKLVQK